MDSSLSWLDGAYGAGWCLTIARDLTADELLARMGAESRDIRPATPSQTGALQQSTGLPVARAGSAGGWSFALEECGSYEGARREVLRRVARGTRAASVLHNAKGMAMFGQADRNKVTVEERPDALAILENEFGFRLDAARVAGRLRTAPLVPLLADLPEPNWVLADIGFHDDDELTDALVGAGPERLAELLPEQAELLADEAGLSSRRSVRETLAALRAGRRIPVDDDSALGRLVRQSSARVLAAERHRGDQRRAADDDERADIERRAHAAQVLRQVALWPTDRALLPVLSWRRAHSDDGWRDDVLAALRN